MRCTIDIFCPLYISVIIYADCVDQCCAELFVIAVCLQKKNKTKTE